MRRSPITTICAHLLIPLNKCRHAEMFLPWKCEDERHVYEKCEYELVMERMLLMQKIREKEKEKAQLTHGGQPFPPLLVVRPSSPSPPPRCPSLLLAELKLLHAYQVKHLGNAAKTLALGLSSRKNLCVNPAVVSAENRDSVDAACRKLTASWVRTLAASNPNIPTCSFFDNYEQLGSNALLPSGVYTLQVFGKEQGWCPYYLARHMVQLANVVVYSYQYLLDPKVAGIISKEMQKESVVVFDEAHNIDTVWSE